MSYGTRKAIGGMRKWEEKTATMVDEAIRRYNDCEAVADVRAVLDWMREFNWFLRSKEQGDKMYEAYQAAVQRAKTRQALESAGWVKVDDATYQLREDAERLARENNRGSVEYYIKLVNAANRATSK